MNTPWIGWLLAAAALVLGWYSMGWQGVILAVSVIAFWLLLQFGRAMRVMKRAAGAPVGYIDSAVMFHIGLHHGMMLMEVVSLAKSLGRKVARDADGRETFRWTDPGGATVTVEVINGRVVKADLSRPHTGESSRPGAKPPTA